MEDPKPGAPIEGVTAATQNPPKSTAKSKAPPPPKAANAPKGTVSAVKTKATPATGEKRIREPRPWPKGEWNAGYVKPSENQPAIARDGIGMDIKTMKRAAEVNNLDPAGGPEVKKGVTAPKTKDKAVGGMNEVELTAYLQESKNQREWEMRAMEVREANGGHLPKVVEDRLIAGEDPEFTPQH